MNWRDVSSLCLDPSQDCGLDVYAQLLGDDGKVKLNKNHHVASFPVNSGGSIMMSKIATGYSGEGREVPLTLPTTHHKKTFFTHQSEQIPCIRMALIVDFVKLDSEKYQSFIQDKAIPDSLVFTDEVQAKLTRQFQQPNSVQVRTIHQEKWLAKYNELIEYKKHNESAAFMCGEKLGNWVHTQRTQYRFLQENKKSNMTEEQIDELLNEIGFTCFNHCCLKQQAQMELPKLRRELAKPKSSTECFINDCKEPKWGKYCKKHHNRNTRCARCNVKALEVGAKTFCLDCNEKFRKEMEEALILSLSYLVKCINLCHRKSFL